MAELKKLIPAINVRPQDILADELKARNLNVAKLAELSKLSESEINLVLLGGKEIDSAIAVGLERALNISQQFWLNLNQNYQAFKSNEN